MTEVQPTPRKRLTPAQKALILERQNDLCAVCKESLIWSVIDGKPIYGPMVDEHWNCLWYGSPDANELHNRYLLCTACAKAKTKKDKAAIAKVKRVKAKDEGTAKRKGPKLKSRGFDKSLSRGFDGKVRTR